MRNVKTSLVISALFASSAALAQAEAPLPPPAVPPQIVAAAPPTAATLKGQTIYVYSFLDVRKDEFGAEVLAQFHRQLLAALKSDGVNPQLQLFADTFQGQLYVPTKKVANGQKTIEQPPVLQTIMDNAGQETAAGARYRLLVLPANFELFGAWRYYTVRWIVMDTATNAIVWKGDYNGKHLTVWRTNENAEGRGRKLVDGGLTLMRSGHLL